MKAARRPRTSPRRPQDGPKAPEDTPRTQKSSQNGTKFAPKWIPKRSKYQNGLKAKNDYFSCINFILFYLWRHPFPCQKRWKNLNKSRLVLLKRFFALEWCWKAAKMRPRCARTAQMSHLGPSWTPRWHHKTNQNGIQTGSKSNRKKGWKKNVGRYSLIGRRAGDQRYRHGPLDPLPLQF